MFFIALKFAENKHQAGEWMAEHSAWLQQGFNDDVFLLAGNLEPAAGGAILAQAEDLDTLHERVNRDPFVIEKVVSAEITEFSPKRCDERLQFLIDQP